MSPAAIEKQRNEHLDSIVRRMYRDMSIDLNNCQAASDWIRSMQAEVEMEKKNARVGARTHGLRSRLRHLVTHILTQTIR